LAGMAAFLLFAVSLALTTAAWELAVVEVPSAAPGAGASTAHALAEKVREAAAKANSNARDFGAMMRVIPKLMLGLAMTARSR
jgi:hypothetical protein